MGLESVEADEASFKAALGSVAASVNVITMWSAEEQPLGMTATAFASVSVDPLLVLVCINRSTRTYAHVTETGRFGVNVLGQSSHEISDYCSRPGGDKALELDWLEPRKHWQSPALSGALAFLDCEVDQNVQAGTHAVIIGAVAGVGLSGLVQHFEPLLHFRGSYRQLESVRQPSVPRPLPIALEELA